MSEMKATRAAYGEALAALGEKYPKLVVLDADLSNATMTKKFGDRFPERFFNCGIAEADMTGIAAGMAAAGLKPFTNTFAVFAAGRAYEQVRNSIAYPGLNVTVVGSHGGISVGEDGATHQAIEDLALMRVVPGMTVVNPCDANEMRCAVEALIRHVGPAYLRLGRAPVETVTSGLPGYRFELGKGVTMREGTDITLVATGLCVQLSMNAAELLEQEGISARVINIHTLKPLDGELLLKAARETGHIVTVEEHSVIGGLGSAVAEFLGQHCPVPVFRHGMEDEFGRSGKAQDVLKHFGFTPRAIAEKALAALGRQPKAETKRPKYYLAIDVSAAAGRHIVGWMEQGKLQTEEVYRFPNGMTEVEGHLTWDMDAITEEVKKGIEIARSRFGRLESLSIDGCGVDYVLLRGDEAVRPCYAYRDKRTESVIPQVHQKMRFSELYRRTGIQFQPFNTIYQLYADKEAGRLEGVTDFLMFPEYLMYRLCGVRSWEYTDATTTGMVDAETGEYDPEIITALGLPSHLFHKLQKPGTVIGTYEGIKVVLCAAHEGASAVEGIPMASNAPYISSGTWSLVGVKTPKPINNTAGELANWSNEGGVGYNRYQKNIMGMWLVNRLREELCPDLPFEELTDLAEESSYGETVDPNASAFLAPEQMKEAFDAALSVKPQTLGDYFRCAYRSLALGYMNALQELQQNTGKTFDRIYIVGGGAKNQFLNRLTGDACGKEVVALPIEATAIGNLKCQIRSDEGAD